MVPPKRQLQPERYAQYFFEIVVKKLKKILTKKKNCR
jgi:hypothetical protein